MFKCKCIYEGKKPKSHKILRKHHTMYEAERKYCHILFCRTISLSEKCLFCVCWEFLSKKYFTMVTLKLVTKIQKTWILSNRFREILPGWNGVITNWCFVWHVISMIHRLKILFLFQQTCTFVEFLHNWYDYLWRSW